VVPPRACADPRGSTNRFRLAVEDRPMPLCAMSQKNSRRSKSPIRPKVQRGRSIRVTGPTRKECSECHRLLPLAEFAPRRKTTVRDPSPANRQSKCKSCMSAVTLAWRQRRTAAALAKPLLLLGWRSSLCQPCLALRRPWQPSRCANPNPHNLPRRPAGN
jgi:hypothetical protein